VTEKIVEPYSQAKILRINLTDGTTSSETISPELVRDFVGGRGLGVKLLYDNVGPETEPLSPENLLIFAVGPATATAVPTAGRTAVITKSPLTGTILDSNVGGYLGPQIRRAGYAAIIFEGRASSPVYVWINEDQIEIRDASSVWGKDVVETTNTLLEDTDKQAQVACIGPAGENQVLLAAIMNDTHRAAGRGGVGAVMGSKNLKALVIRGSGKVPIADDGRMETAVKHSRLLIKKNGVTDKSLPVFGTAVLVNVINEHGMLPTYNFQEGMFNDAEGVSGEKLLERLYVKQYRCHGCPIGCGRISKAYGKEVGGPEYETIWAFGPQCGINDLEWITEANHLCNLYGIDTISLGSTIGCAMELVQKGHLDAPLEFSNTEGILDLIRDVALAKGLGAEIGEGSLRLAKRYGAPDLAMHVKGLEIPAYDPRGIQGHALGYATSNRGGCHLRSYLIGPEVMGSPVLVDRDRVQGKPELVILYQNLSAAVDTLVACRFSQFALNVDDYAEFLSAILGEEIDGRSFLEIGERIWNLERLFNQREGFSSKDDCLPPRFFSPLPEGGSRNRIVHLEEMLTKYFSLRGWDSDGNPSEKTMKRLSL
jgi:aldehyde:ferredoxin oxidoreductase